MLHAALIDDEDKVIQILSVADAGEIGELNQRAQDAGSGYEWRPVTKEDWRRLGEMTALFAAVGEGFNGSR